MNEHWKSCVCLTESTQCTVFIITAGKETRHHHSPGSWEKTLLNWDNAMLQVWLRITEAVEIDEAVKGEECFHRKIAGHVQEVPLKFM